MSAKANARQPFRKLSFFSDKEGKTRVIGIVDYWSQSALRPLHLFVNRLLKSLDQDMTFNQSKFTNNPISKGTHKFHSIDLSAATDRMPILLQKRILSLFMTNDKVEAWHRLLTFYPFALQSPCDGMTEVKYETGQPMGAYSS